MNAFSMAATKCICSGGYTHATRRYSKTISSGILLVTDAVSALQTVTDNAGNGLCGTNGEGICVCTACVVFGTQEIDRGANVRLIFGCVEIGDRNRCTVCSVRSSNLSWRMEHGRSRRRVVVYTLHILQSAKVWSRYFSRKQSM
jgi:hypothetical protein